MRALAAYGPMPETDLSLLLRPIGLTEKKDEWADSLQVLQELALIDRGDNSIGVAEGVMANTAGDGPREFRLVVRTALLLHARSSIVAGDQPNDLAQGLFWLSLVPHEALWVNGDDPHMVSSLTTRGFRDAIKNKEQWNSFARWARALGLISSGGRNSPDFSVALRDALPASKQSVSISELLQQVTISVPGSHDPVLQEWYRTLQPKYETTDVGPVLSWAFYRLQHEGRVELLYRDDAPGAIQFPRPLGVISHVEVLIP